VTFEMVQNDVLVTSQI